jgi:hypothetical protein
MKILNRADFLAISDEVIFAKYWPCTFSELNIKLGNCGTDDFLTVSLTDIDVQSSEDFVDKLEDSVTNGTEISIDLESAGRDGCFDDDQLFAVWSTQDVEIMIHRLARTLPKGTRIRNLLGDYTDDI